MLSTYPPPSNVEKTIDVPSAFILVTNPSEQYGRSHSESYAPDVTGKFASPVYPTI
jgi:hypothetical protein